MRLHRLANPDLKVVSLSDHLLGWIDKQSQHVGNSTTGVIGVENLLITPRFRWSLVGHRRPVMTWVAMGGKTWNP